MHSVPWQLWTNLFLNLHYGTTQYGNKKWSTISPRLRTATSNHMLTQPQQQASTLTHGRVASCTTGALDCANSFSYFFSTGPGEGKFRRRRSSSLLLTKLKQRGILLPLCVQNSFASAGQSLHHRVREQAKHNFLYHDKTMERERPSNTLILQKQQHEDSPFSAALSHCWKR